MKDKKATGEVGAKATDGGSKVEFMLCGITKFTFPPNQDLLKDPNIWIADSAATVHTTAHKQGFHTLTEATDADSITMGNGIAEKASLVGKITGTMCNHNGMELGSATLADVVHLPTGQFNLFSLTKMTQQGWILGGNKTEIWLEKGKQRLSFDIAIPTPKGMLFAMYIHRDLEIAGANTDVPVPAVSIQTAHDRLAHPGEDNVRKTAKALGWTLTRGNLKPCDACASGKAKQRNVPKVSRHQPATDKNEVRIFLDLATVKSPKDGPRMTKPNWRVMVDERGNQPQVFRFLRHEEWNGGAYLRAAPLVEG
jgi:hypothetical protein